MGNKCYVDLNTIRLSNVALGTPSGGSSSGSGNAPDSGVTLKPMEGIVKFNDTGKPVEITFPDGVTELEYYSLAGYTLLQRITAPESVAYIRQDAFGDCESLQRVTLLGVREIEYNAFRGLQRLQSITIHGGITHISTAAFLDSDNLTDVQLINFGSVNTTEYVIYLDTPINWSHDSMVKSLLTDSFDRASAGYPVVEIFLGDNLSKLSQEEIAAITAKGYTLTQ